MNKKKLTLLILSLLFTCGIVSGVLLMNVIGSFTQRDGMVSAGLLAGVLLLLQAPGVPIAGRWLYDGRDPLAVNFQDAVQRKYRRRFGSWRRVGIALIGAALILLSVLPLSILSIVLELGLVGLALASFAVAFFAVISQPARLDS